MKHAVDTSLIASRHRTADPQSAVLRELMSKADLTLSGASRLLDIPQPVLRRYCSGLRVPRVVLLAMESLVDMEQWVNQPSQREDWDQR